MSEWTRLQGDVWLSKCSGFSFKTYITENFQEAEPYVSQQPCPVIGVDKIKVTLEFSFSDAGLKAAKAVDWFVRAIKQADPKAVVELEVETRFT